MHQAALIKDIVNEEEHSLAGTFKLAVLPTIAPYLLPRFFQQLTEKHPDMDLRILEMQTVPTIQALQKGEIDAAIIASYPLEANMQSESLFYEEYFAYVSRKESLFKKKI